MPPRKRTIGEVGELREPVFTKEQWGSFRRGIKLFNNGQYWHAHEAWEDTWKLMGDGSEDDAEIILRGLIQLAAAMHLRGRTGREAGMQRNFEKALEKLKLTPFSFLGIALGELLRDIEEGLKQPPNSGAPIYIRSGGK